MIKKRTDTVACPESYAEYTSYNNTYIENKIRCTPKMKERAGTALDILNGTATRSYQLCMITLWHLCMCLCV